MKTQALNSFNKIKKIAVLYNSEMALKYNHLN